MTWKCFDNSQAFVLGIMFPVIVVKRWQGIFYWEVRAWTLAVVDEAAMVNRLLGLQA